MASFFGGNNAAAAPSGDIAQRKEQMKQSIQQELAVVNAQQLITKINENCFEKCVPRPGSNLSSSEEQCLSRCMTLYSAAFDQVSQKYIARVFRERQGSMGAGEVKLETL